MRTPTASTRMAAEMRMKENVAEEMRRTVLDKMPFRGDNRLNNWRTFKNRILVAHT